MRAGLIQMTSSDDPTVSLRQAQSLITKAAKDGAAVVLTPEVTNVVSSNRAWLDKVLMPEAQDPTLAALRAQASDLGIWLLIGSLGIRTDDADGRFANRSFMINPEGEITARYDKIHMFDVTVSETERYHESASYRPGTEAVIARTPWADIGMTICYDLRFPHLYAALAKAGARILTVPAAFTVPTGRAHWETLLRARAIETGCFVLAPAQVGTHIAHDGRKRETWGHSLAISPWGEILGDGGEAPGVTLVDLDLSATARARARIPALSHHVSFAPPRAADDDAR